MSNLRVSSWRGWVSEGEKRSEQRGKERKGKNGKDPRSLSASHLECHDGGEDGTECGDDAGHNRGEPEEADEEVHDGESGERGDDGGLGDFEVGGDRGAEEYGYEAPDSE